MLTPWALNYNRLKKWIALLCYQYWDLKRVSLFHATSSSEFEDIRRLKLKQTICVAPLGVAFPHKEEIKKVPPVQQQKRTLLFFSRVHPKKGLINLVDAWALLKNSEPNKTDTRIANGWQVLIAGPSEVNYADAVMARIRQKGVTEDFQILGPVYGTAKDELYKNADLFVLPTFSENFGSVVIEALAWGCPVITTKGAPWQELETYQCGKWIDIGVMPLVEALKEMMGMSVEKRHRMGMNGYHLVSEKYTWASVGHRMLDAYRNAKER
jgi:glycosyltransferase involved in cell wall biosynthesis